MPKSRCGFAYKGMNLDGYFNNRSMNCKWIPITWLHQMQHQPNQITTRDAALLSQWTCIQEGRKKTQCLFYRMLPGNQSWDFRFCLACPSSTSESIYWCFSDFKNWRCVFRELTYCWRSPSFSCTIEGDLQQIDFFKGMWQYWRLKLELGSLSRIKPLANCNWI